MRLLFNINQPKTWIIDLDGTIVSHNGYKKGKDLLLDGVSDFFKKNINVNDIVIITTSRQKKYKNQTIKFLKENEISYNYIIFDLPYGERILINDNKPDGMETTKCISLERNLGLQNIFVESKYIDN